VATLTDIADAVVAELNGHTFSLSFTAARMYRPLFDLKELSTLHVTVAPAGFTVEPLDRARNQEEYVIDVAVQQAPDPLDNAHLDPLAGLVEEIAAFFRLRRPATYATAICIKAALAPGSDRGFLVEHLDEMRLFTSILALTFRVVR